MTQYNFFIASRYRNRPHVLELAQKIREKERSCYCFIQSDATTSYVNGIDSDSPEDVMEEFEAIDDWRNDPKVQRIFKTDMDALKAADTLVLLLPAGKSSHLETGVAYGLGKKLILIGEQQETESLYLMFDEFYNTIDEFISTLEQGEKQI